MNISAYRNKYLAGNVSMTFRIPFAHHAVQTQGYIEFYTVVLPYKITVYISTCEINWPELHTENKADSLTE